MPTKQGEEAVKRLAVGAAIILLMMFAAWSFFLNMGSLPEGELMATSISPDGEYTVNLYLCGGNATTADSVRGEVVSEGKKRNIYWQYKEFNFDIRWESDTEVNINGVILDVRTDTYDWRK